MNEGDAFCSGGPDALDSGPAVSEVLLSCLSPQRVISLHYLEEHSIWRRTPLSYLHEVRKGSSTFATEAQYQERQAGYVARFAGGLQSFREMALVAAPSTRFHLVQPYYDAVRKRHLGPDLSSCFRKGAILAGRGDVTCAALDAAIQFEARRAPREVDVEGVLLVDDVFATGKTAGVLLRKLSAWTGREMPAALACPLRVVGLSDRRSVNGGLV